MPFYIVESLYGYYFLWVIPFPFYIQTMILINHKLKNNVASQGLTMHFQENF
jgi:hypothetical protein